MNTAEFTAAWLTEKMQNGWQVLDISFMNNIFPLYSFLYD